MASTPLCINDTDVSYSFSKRIWNSVGHCDCAVSGSGEESNIVSEDDKDRFLPHSCLYCLDWGVSGRQMIFTVLLSWISQFCLRLTNSLFMHWSLMSPSISNWRLILVERASTDFGMSDSMVIFSALLAPRIIHSFTGAAIIQMLQCGKDKNTSINQLNPLCEREGGRESWWMTATDKYFCSGVGLQSNAIQYNSTAVRATFTHFIIFRFCWDSETKIKNTSV